MSTEEYTDEKLIDNLQAGVDFNNSLNILVGRHSGAFFSMASRFFPEGRDNASSVDKELVFGSKDLVIYNSALSFDKARGVKFVTHLCNNARFFCLHQIHKSKDLVNFENSEFENIFAEESTEEIQSKIDSSLVKKIVEVIEQDHDERVKKLFRLRYFSSDRVVPWTKIYRHIPRMRHPDKHLTIQGCINLHDKTIKALQKKAKKMVNNEEE